MAIPLSSTSKVSHIHSLLLFINSYFYYSYLLNFNLNIIINWSIILFSCLMIIQHDLCVITWYYLCPFHILILLCVWVHVYYFPITLISKQKSWFTTTCVDFEIWAVIWCAYSCFPIVITQISWFWNQFLTSTEYRLEILSFESMSIIYIAWYLSFLLRVLHSEEDNSKPSTIKNPLLSFC